MVPGDAITAHGRPVAPQECVNKSEGHRRGRRTRPLRTLLQLRQDRDLTLRELAGRAGLVASVVSQIERGHRVATVTEAEQLARALGLAGGALATRTMLVHEEDA